MSRPTVTVKLEGAEDLALQLRQLPEVAQQTMKAGLWAAAQVIRNHAVENIAGGQKTGRIYRRGKRGRTHQASAPGEYPAANTGNLMRGIQMRAIKVLGLIAVDVNANASYAEPLELKAPERGGRPFLSRAFNEKIEEASAILVATLNAVLPGDRTARRR